MTQYIVFFLCVFFGDSLGVMVGFCFPIGLLFSSSNIWGCVNFGVFFCIETAPRNTPRRMFLGVICDEMFCLFGFSWFSYFGSLA